MSINTVLGYFCKSGPWHQHSRRFHKLDRDAKLKAVELIIGGKQPDKAIQQAKRESKNVNNNRTNP